MKKFLIIASFFASISFVNAQVFTGKGDTKFQVGANFQEYGSGVIVTYDYGIGKNMSVGLTSLYLLGIKEINSEKPNFDDRFDLRARFSANIADVFNIEEKVDIYPGLNIGVKNFGAHLGARYFFTPGFGVYSEIQFPIAMYDNDPIGFEKYNNQFNFSIGASFNL
ncbi:DUF6646 family protein [Flavobacterium channae]|uniref:DUF6646 family protein n=1 Tax=Flavobacterium channae TaxID=2897181 RepID=UPI001E632A25|nr:DUF6646 family protein [Flavobacterium channae]UGS23731.1 hypothetical protein LOS89_00305 [Flavobacterium channae]